MRRILSAGLVVISICLTLVSISHTMGRMLYSDHLISEADFSELTENRTTASDDLLTELYFNGHPLFYDETTARWFYSVSGDDPELDPGVSFVSSEKKAKIGFRDDLIPGGTGRVLVFTDKEYREYEIVVTTLPLIRIESDDPDFLETVFTEETIFDPREVVPIRFTLIDNRTEAIRKVTVSEGSIHYHGDSTLYKEKKGFRLTLYQKGAGKEQQEYQADLLGMRPDGDWLLYPAYNDQEKIRNVFSTNLWFASCADDNSFGLKNGNEYRFAELFWNRQYWGLYALGYPIDVKQMNIAPDNRGHYEEFLFKQKAWGPKTTDLRAGYDGSILQFDADEGDLNNGVLILKMYFNQIQTGAPGSLWNSDTDNALDVWLYMKLIQAYDSVRFPGKMKNMMITIKKNETGRKIIYTPWDMDICWGNIWEAESDNFTVPYALNADDNSYELDVSPVHALMGTESEITDLVRERYAVLRADGWSDETIDAMLDSYEKDIYGSGAYVRDMERWPNGTYQDPESGLSVFREYVHARLASMDSFIDSLEESVRF